MAHRVQRPGGAAQNVQSNGAAAPAAPPAHYMSAAAPVSTTARTSPMDLASSSNARLATLQKTVEQKPHSPEAWAEIAAIMDSANSAVRDLKQMSEAYTRLVYMGHRPSLEAAKRFARTTHDVALGVALLNAGQTSVLPWLTRGMGQEMGAGSKHGDALLDALRKHALVNHDAKLMCDLVRHRPAAVHALYVMLEDYKAHASRADVQARRWPGLKDAVEELLQEWMQADNSETATLLAALSDVAPGDYVPPKVADEIVECVLGNNIAKARNLAAAFAPQLLAVAASAVGGHIGVGAEVAAALLSLDDVDNTMKSVKAHLDTAYAAVRKVNPTLTAKVEAVADMLHVKLNKGGMFSCFNVSSASEPAVKAGGDAGKKAGAAADAAATQSTPVPAEAAAAT